MTMADEIDPMGNARQVSDFQISNNNNSITTNQNIPWKQRKRKRLSAVLDKLHNNNTITKRCLNESDEVIGGESNNNNNNNNNNNKNHSNNNQGEPSKIPLIDLQHHNNQQQQHVGNESVRSSVGDDDDDDDDDDDNGDDDRSDFENRLNEELTNASITEYPSMVKREQVNSSSPLGNENVAFNGDIKQENRTSDYEYATNQRIEQNISPMERYFPQMSSPLFEYYLQTKYFPDILRMRNNLQVQNSDSKIAKLLPELQQQQQQQIQQRQRMEQYSPSHNSQTLALDLQQKPMKRENDDDTKIQLPTKKQRQRQPKQHQYTEKLSPPPPQDVPLDLSMKTILENITKATAIHKQSRSPSTSSTSSSISTVLNQWQNQPHDLSTNLANILVNPAHLNNHAAYTVAAAAAAAAVHHNQIPHIATSTGNQTMGQVPIIKGDVASPTTKESVAFRYNLNVSPVVEEMPPGTDVAYVCPICGQMFSLHDRLAKHMASRHKSKSNSSEITKSYVCEVCDRSFARSDMLTRHMRLHTGIKPYTCKVCNQVFSRSDHLSTHQRTHTGEKPYKCPQCPYAACRRDMITRHMRTHARYEAQRAAAAAAVAASNNGSTIIDTTNVNQFERNFIGNNHNLSKVKIKIEDNNQQNVSPKTLSPAYPASTIIKAENLC